MPEHAAPPRAADSLLWSGRRYPLRQPFVIGRAADCHLVLADGSISRHHALLCQERDGWWLFDLCSRNGVWLNGEKLAMPRRLRDGDWLQLAGHKLAFHSQAELARRATARDAPTSPAAPAPGPAAPAPGSEAIIRAALERLRAQGLSAREAEVLRWVCAGKTNGETGQILGISCRTVCHHMEHILAKLGVENRQGAIVLVLSGPGR